MDTRVVFGATDSATDSTRDVNPDLITVRLAVKEIGDGKVDLISPVDRLALLYPDEAIPEGWYVIGIWRIPKGGGEPQC